MIEETVKKERAIVYGLGKCWKEYAEKIMKDYVVLFCSDRNPIQVENCKGIEYITPDDIISKDYDVLILCNFAFGMREELILKYGLKPERMVYCLELYGDSITRPEKSGTKNVNKLTILIPTYNRRLRLERTLDLLELQNNQNFNIVILDDKSDYDINDVVEKRKNGFAAKIRVERNISNLGLAGNTAMAFTKVDEGWVWTLADDDIPSIYAVELIHQEIEEADEAAIILFSIREMGKYMKDSYIEFDNLSEMLSFYQGIRDVEKNSGVSGDFIFYSNKVFNMSYVKKYLKEIFTYLYTTIPQNIPILFGLDNKAFKVRISNKKIVSYSAPDGDHWSWLDNGVGMTILADLPLHITDREKAILYRLCMFDYLSVFQAASTEDDKTAYEKLEKMYFRLYQYYLSDEQKQEYLDEMHKIKSRMN